MTEYIDRRAALDALYDANAITYAGLDILENIPAADVAPVKHGKWINHNDDILGLTSECSVCHIEGMLNGNYCPNCGAKMDEDG